MLDASRYNLVDPADITFCTACGNRYMPDLQFVGFDNNAVGEEVPSGLIHTLEKRGGVNAYQARDGFSGDARAILVHQPQMCSDCIARAAELVGYADTAPLHATLQERERQLLELRQELERSERERIDADAALRATKVFDRLLPDPDHGKADEAKRPPGKARAGKAG